MLRQKYPGKLALLAGLSLSFGLVNFGYSDTASPSQSSSASQSGPASQSTTAAPESNSNPSVITTKNNFGNESSTYDLSAALSRDAAAKTTLNNATIGYSQAMAQARKDFRVSAEYRNAAKELSDARETYTAAQQPILAKLTDNADYHSLIESRTQFNIALSNPNLSPQHRLQLAEQKLSINNRISQMEATAFAADSSITQAKSRVTTAERAMNDLTNNFETSIYSLPVVMTAKQSLDSAKTEYAAAEANLNGATIARNDLMNSDLRNSTAGYSPYNSYPYVPYGYGGYPYGFNYGLPFFPFGGGSIIVTPGSGTTGSGNIVNLMQQQTGRFFP